VFQVGSSYFCQIWLLVFVVNVPSRVNTEPFVEIRILDRVIRKMKVLHVYTTTPRHVVLNQYSSYP